MRSLYVFFAVLCSYSVCSADEVNQEEVAYNPPPVEQNECCCQPNTYPFELRVGYYYFFSPTLRDVFKSGGLDLQLAFTYPFTKWTNQQLGVYFAAEYVGAWGHSHNFHQRTFLSLMPLSLGLKYTVAIACKWDWYMTFGPRYVFLWQHNHSNFVDKHVSGNNIGFFGGTGFLVQLPKRWFLDFYLDASYCRIKPSVHKTNVFATRTQVGGLAAGAGFGRNF